MTALKSKAAGAKPAAARAERKNGKPPEIDFRGRKLVLPKKISGDVAFAYAELEDAESRSLAPIINFIRSLVGDEQLKVVRTKIREDDVSMDEVAAELFGLVESVFAAYGSSTGESSASPKS